MKQDLKQKILKNSDYKVGTIEHVVTKPIFRTSTNYRTFPKVYKILSNERITESAGYITAKQRIENMILAGQRLVEFRKEQFDFPDKIDENFSDPTRDKNFDLADATMLSLENEERLKQQKAENDKKLAEEKQKKEALEAAEKKEFENFKKSQKEKKEDK